MLLLVDTEKRTERGKERKREVWGLPVLTALAVCAKLAVCTTLAFVAVALAAEAGTITLCAVALAVSAAPGIATEAGSVGVSEVARHKAALRGLVGMFRVEPQMHAVEG